MNDGVAGRQVQVIDTGTESAVRDTLEQRATGNQLTAKNNGSEKEGTDMKKSWLVIISASLLLSVIHCFSAPTAFSAGLAQVKIAIDEKVCFKALKGIPFPDMPPPKGRNPTEEDRRARVKAGLGSALFRPIPGFVVPLSSDNKLETILKGRIRITWLNIFVNELRLFRANSLVNLWRIDMEFLKRNESSRK